MLELKLFTDGSVDTKQKIGYGAFFILTDIATPVHEIEPLIAIKRFESTSSTKLELQIFLQAVKRALKLAKGKPLIITAYTDSQNIVGLPARRTNLENNNFYSSKGKRLNNFELYQQFYTLLDRVTINLVKVEGHKKSQRKDNIDTLFSLVDKASRNALRTSL